MNAPSVALGLDPLVWRRDFPILEAVHPNGAPLVYFDNAASAQRPRQVIAAEANLYERGYANVHRGIHWLSEHCTDAYERARERVRQFVRAAHREEIIFTHGTTESINLVARSWGDANLRSGDEIVLTEMEHHANLVPWQQLAVRTGAVLRHVPISDDGQLLLDELPKLLNSRTRLVACTAMSNVLGTINPVGEIVRLAHEAGALALVDAAQSAPHLGADVVSLGADFLAFSGHKLMGPTGVGVLYGRRELLEAMPPFLGGGGMIRKVALDRFEPAESPEKFEAGTPPIAQAVGLGAAIEYIDRVGLDAIRAHEDRLVRRTHERLIELGGVHIHGPAPEHKGGIVAFTVEGVHAHDAAQVLDRHGVAVRAGHHCAMPLHKRLRLTATVRASFYFYNMLDEVERLVDGLRDAQSLFRRR